MSAHQFNRPACSSVTSVDVSIRSLCKNALKSSGYCLLHAASLGMWGFHDRLLTLRKALHRTLQHCSEDSGLWRRWRWQQTQANKQSGLILSEDEWCEDWNYLLRQSSAKPRSTPGTTSSCCDSPATRGLMERTTEEKESEKDTEVFYESLEEFHVFILAHVLKRPIVVVADTILKDADGGALAPIPFGGIYLPLECHPADCHRPPLLLTYDAAHFSALVTMDKNCPADALLPTAIPLVDPNLELLHIHFIIDPGPAFHWGRDELDDRRTKDLYLTTEEKLTLLRRYLDIVPIPIPRRRSSEESSDDVSVHRRSSSFSGTLDQKASSSDSTDSNCLSSGENIQIREKSSTLDNKTQRNNLKDFKDKEKTEKNRVAKQISKSFGSLGRSVSKKLKKMGKIHSSSKESVISKRSSSGSVTQSTKKNHIAYLHDKERILAAQLHLRRLNYQHEMVENYLQGARERFEQERVQRRRQDIEMKQRAEQRKAASDSKEECDAGKRQPSPVLVECINKECPGKGSAETCYLCRKCYSEQKQQELSGSPTDKNISYQAVVPKNPNLYSQSNYEKCRSNLAKPESTESLDMNYDDHIDSSSRPVSRISRQNTLIETGMSKFYTLDIEDHCLPVAGDNQSVLPISTTTGTLLNNDGAFLTSHLNNSKMIRREHNQTRPIAVELARSSFYDQPLSFEAKSHTLKSERQFVNNLHNEWQEKENMNQRGKHYSKPAPLEKEYTNEMCHVAAGGSPTCKASAAMKGRESQMDDARAEYDQALQHVQPKTIAISQENLATSATMPAKLNILQKPCKESGCRFFGTIATDFYCTACFKRLQKKLAYEASQQN